MTIDQSANPMKRKQRNGTTTSSALFNSSSNSKQQTLPDDCWESIFKFIIINDNNNDDDCNINNHYLNSISLVSRQFLSIINRLPFSLTLHGSPFGQLVKPFPQLSLSPTVSYSRSCTVDEQLQCCRIFKRFTNLTSLNLNNLTDLKINKLLDEITRFPLKQLTSLNIFDQLTFPANELRAFSQKITTLTSLTFSHLRFPNSLNSSDLFLIAECFPLLEQLDISYSGRENHDSYVDGIEALSLALIKLREVNLSRFPINNQSLFHLYNNCKHLEEVIMFGCYEITKEGIASALRARPTLRSISLRMQYSEVFTTSQVIDSIMSLKSWTCLVLNDLNISDEFLYSIAREDLPLTRLDLPSCNGYSYAGIFHLLSECQCIKHLNLEGTDYLNDQHVVQLSSFLGDLVSINLSNCRLLTQSALFTLAKNCPSLSEIKMEKIEGEVVGNSDSFVDFYVYPQLKSLYLGKNSWLGDEIITLFASIFPNLQLLDLNYCHNISEGIFQVLRRCCKIKHLNLAYCSRVKLHGINFVVPNLKVLNLSNTDVDNETLYVISKNCCGLSQLLLRECNDVTKTGVKHVLENCTQLREVVGRDLDLSDKYWKLVSRYEYFRR